MVIEPNQTGKCPHCGIANRFEEAVEKFRGNCSKQYIFHKTEYAKLQMCRCTNCGMVVIFFEDKMIFPLGAIRSSAPRAVSPNIAKDFNEACLVEPLSKKASAALARRCLQNMLRDRGITKGDLDAEITEAIKTLPSHLSEAIEAIRVIGNFAAHPMKSKNTGEIVDVEDGETEWILTVLEQLFDFYYVQPEITKAKRAALNAKLSAMGKPQLK